MKRPVITCLFVLAFSQIMLAQYQYSVTTLLPQNSHLLDDGLTLDDQGTLYGSYWGIWQGAAGTHVLRYRTNGSLDTLATGLVRPNGISYYNGFVYVASSGTGELVRIDTNGVKEVLMIVPGGISNAIPVPETDSLLILSWAESRIMARNEAGNTSIVVSSPLLNGAVGGDFDEEGRFYIGNFNDGKILKLEDGVLSVLADIGGGIGFLTYSDGAILATNHTDKKVYRISIEDGSFMVIAGSGQAMIQDGIGENASFMSPNGIVATPSGDTIYVSEFAGKALRMITRIPNVVDVEEAEIAKTLKVFPLPNKGIFNIQGVDLKKVKNAIVRDSSGRIVRQFSSTDLASQQLDCHDQAAGLYSLCLLGESGQILHTIQIPIIK